MSILSSFILPPLTYLLTFTGVESMTLWPLCSGHPIEFEVWGRAKLIYARITRLGIHSHLQQDRYRASLVLVSMVSY